MLNLHAGMLQCNTDIEESIRKPTVKLSILNLQNALQILDYFYWLCQLF